MLATIEGEGRRLYDRGPGALGLVVDNDGVSLGSRYPLVERRAGSYCVIERDAAGVLLRTVFDAGGPVLGTSGSHDRTQTRRRLHCANDRPVLRQE